MYTYKNIALQNKQDVFSEMFACVGRSLFNTCGRGAEGAIREAVRRLGKDRGSSLKEAISKAGLKTNLHSLYHCCGDCAADPRFRVKWLVDEEQRQIWEVYTCPLADLWRTKGEAALGNLFCEESQHAIVAAYTDGKGQTNLSKVLTSKRDNFCRFSVFFREANMADEQAKRSLTHRDPEHVAPAELPADASFDEGIKMLTIKTYYYLLEVAEERFGSEGVCAVSQGTIAWANAAIPFLKRKASATLNLFSEDFAARNFQLSLDSSEDALWAEYAKNDARALVQKHLLDAMKKALAV